MMKVGDYIIARGDRSGVFAGTLKKDNGKEVTLKNVRRLWYWSGAASLSQLAEEGVKKPNTCKFPVEVSEIVLTDVIEKLAVSKIAKKNIAEVPVWKQ